MRGKTRNALLGYGLNTDLIEKIARHNYTVESLRSATKPKLAETFTEDEIEILKARIERAPVPHAIFLVRSNAQTRTTKQRSSTTSRLVKRALIKSWCVLI